MLTTAKLAKTIHTGNRVSLLYLPRKRQNNYRFKSVCYMSKKRPADLCRAFLFYDV